MIYNLAFDYVRMQYSAQYEASLEFSSHFQSYSRQLAERLIEEYDLRGKTIIEIGCGQGAFLSLLCEGRSNRGIGFDPNYDPQKTDTSRTPDITFLRDYYTDVYSDYHADFICCRHTLEHVPNPSDFLSQVRRAVGKKETVVYFEVPNALYTLRDLAIWDIIYEHCSYFTPPSLSRLFTEAGFNILRLYEAYGGQFLCIEAVPRHDKAHSKPGRLQGVSEVAKHISIFANNHRQKIEAWTKGFRDFRRRGKRVAVWGAGSKGVTFLNMLQVGHDQIHYVIDMNPRKQGLYVPGTGQRIDSPKVLSHSQPDLIIVMNAIYQDEIHHMTRDMNAHTRLLAA